MRLILEEDAGFGSLGKDVCKWKAEVCKMTSRPEEFSKGEGLGKGTLLGTR